jgi:ADP-heptose:LPS heptosyltransferase
VLFKLLDSFVRPILYFASLACRKKVIHLSKSPINISVIKLSALGDILCLVPSIVTIKKFCPSLRISFVTTFRGSPDYIEKLNLFDEIIVLNTSLSGFVASLLSVFSSVHRSDVVVDCDQSYQLSELISLSCPFSIGFYSSVKGRTFSLTVPYSPLSNERYLFYSLFNKLSSCCNLPLPSKPLLVLDSLKHCSISDLTYSKYPELIGFLSKSLPLILLYPGSSLNAIYRRWPLSSFEELYYLLSSKYDVVFVGGPSEVSLIPYLSTFVPESKLFISKLSLYELSIFISNFVDLLIGNDSSLIHLSDLCGVPTFGLFGPNTSSKWGPVAKNSKYFSSLYPCSPCMHPYMNIVPSRCRYQSDTGNAPCMELIEPFQIFSAVNALFDSAH